MKHPHVVLFAFDDWLANQLRELVAERRWILAEVRQLDGWVSAAAGRQPCVAVLQADFTADRPAALAAVAELHGRNPDADVVVVSDTKMSDDDRPGWTAAALDVGARLVLFPPLTRVVLEDAVSGLMDTRVSRPTPLPEPLAPAIDLAAGEYEADE